MNCKRAFGVHTSEYSYLFVIVQLLVCVFVDCCIEHMMSCSLNDWLPHGQVHYSPVSLYASSRPFSHSLAYLDNPL